MIFTIEAPQPNMKPVDHWIGFWERRRDQVAVLRASKSHMIGMRMDRVSVGQLEMRTPAFLRRIKLNVTSRKVVTGWD